MLNKLLPFIMVLTLALLSGCSGSGDANDAAAGKPNSFPGKSNPGSGFSEQGTGDSGNAGTSKLGKNEVLVTLEVPKSLAPDGELSRRNLHLIQPDSVRVYRSNSDLAEVASVNINIRTTDDGITVIEFQNGQPLGPDVLVEATVNGTTMRAYATDRDRDIKINPFSEYIVRHGLGDYEPDEFATVMDCVNATEEICINKFVWSTLADQIQDFEIDIPSGISFEGAVAFVGQRADFRRYVRDMANLALIPPGSSDKIDAQSLGLNSIFFGIELGRSNLASSDDSRPGQWGTQSAVEKVIESNGTTIVYPGASLASLSLFGISGTFIAINFPYARNTLVQFDSNTYQTQSPSFWEVNGHSSTSNSASIKNDNELVSGQALLQTITGKSKPRTIGWTRNPFVRDSLLDGDSGNLNGLLSSYFTGGKAIELEGESGNYDRGKQLEEHFVSVFDIDLPQSEDFDIGKLKSAYNVISFSLQLGLDEQTPFRAESLAGRWDGGGGQFTQTATANELTRSGGGTVALTKAVPRDGQRLISNRTSVRSKADKDDGRLNLDISNETTDDRQKPELGIGASSPDGSLIAFNLSNGTNGEGVLIGVQRGASSPKLGTYRMQGTIIDLALDTNRLRQITNAPLSITGTSKATANFGGLDVVQTVSDDSLQRPQTLQANDIDMTYTANSGEITFSAGNLKLTGFVASDSKYMLLQVRDTQASGQQSLGLVLATREDG